MRHCRPTNRRSQLCGILSLFAGFQAAAQDADYGIEPNWLSNPPTHVLGAVSDVEPAGDGRLWVLERCGQNGCADQPERPPIHLYAASGEWLTSFGAGLFVWPHGLHVDPDGNLWVTDGRIEDGRGHQVHQFSPTGERLQTLGTAGVSGAGEAEFSGPTDVAVARDGTIFIADGHEVESNNRIMKFSASGEFLMSWGGTGSAPGQFIVPHALQLDRDGRLWVADRNNNRLQVFDRDGRFIHAWEQFGRPSGLYIEPDFTLVVTDNQSNTERNPGWPRGLRIGSAASGDVTGFIAEPGFDPAREIETGPHGIAPGADGIIYGADVQRQTVTRYAPR